MKQITIIPMNNKNIAIQISKHANERLHKRMESFNLTEWSLVGNIIMLGTKLIDYAEAHEDFAIIDNNLKFSVICEAIKISDKDVQIRIITIIDKANIWVKEDTMIARIN